MSRAFIFTLIIFLKKKKLLLWLSHSLSPLPIVKEKLTTHYLPKKNERFFSMLEIQLDILNCWTFEKKFQPFYDICIPGRDSGTLKNFSRKKRERLNNTIGTQKQNCKVREIYI